MPAKLKRNPTKKQKAPKESAAKKNPPVTIAIVLGALAALLLILLASSLQRKETVLVAKEPIAPYTPVTDGMLQEKSVPSDSVDKQFDLTPDKLAEYKGKGKVLIARTEIFQGQRVHQRALTDSAVGSLSVVKDDERVVAISTSYSGVVGGAVVPGSVVDIISAGGSGPLEVSGNSDSGSAVLAKDVKVLGVGVGEGAASGLRPQGAGSLKGQGKNAANPSGSNTIIVVVAVKPDVAAAIAAAQGQDQLMMALNPRMTFNTAGELCEIGKCTDDAQPTSTEKLPADSSKTPTEVNPAADPAADPATAQDQLPADPTAGDTATTSPKQEQDGAGAGR